MKKYSSVLAKLMIALLLVAQLQYVILPIHAGEKDASSDMIRVSSDWQGSVMGDVGGQDKITSENFSIRENEDSSVTLRSANDRGKIASSSEGIAYYFKEIPEDTDFELTTTATVDSWTANNQVGFGIMLRSNVAINEHLGSDFTGDYLAVGALQQQMQSFYKQGEDSTREDGHVFAANAPWEGEKFQLSIKKLGDLYTVTVNGETETVEAFSGDIHYAGLFTSRNTTVTFSDTNLDIEEKIELGDWNFDVFGSNTGDEKNPDPTMNDDGSVTIQANGGKISSSVDGLSFFHKQLPADANFEINTTATVQQFDANDSQVSFGLMIRDAIGEHRSSDGHEANYVGVGGLDGGMRGFFKAGSKKELEAFPGHSIPASGETYELSIKKSGNTYVMESNGEQTEAIQLDDAFTDNIYAGFYAARSASITFSNYEIIIDTKSVSHLSVNTDKMKTEYLINEEIDLNGLEVTAEYSDGTTEKIAAADYIVTGFDSSEAGKKEITVHFAGQTTTFLVDIVPLTVTDLSIVFYPAKTTYYKGDAFEPQGLAVTAEYNDGYQFQELSSDQYTIIIDGEEVTDSGYIFEQGGAETITIMSKETPSETTSFTIQVKDSELDEILVDELPRTTTYFIGDELDVSGMVIHAKYSDGETVRLLRDEYEITPLDSFTPGTKEVEVQYKGKSVTFEVEVKEKEATGLEVVSYPQTTFEIGENFNSHGLEVAKVYDNGEEELLATEDYTVDSSAFNKEEAGEYSIGIYPTDSSLDSISYPITVREQREAVWNSIRFGQSTSYDGNTIEELENGTIRLAALDGAGKITGDHDGITFYYTELDAKEDNFTLSADIHVENYAKDPQDGQESFGIMARDAIGTDGDSSVFASNIAAIGGYSGGTTRPNGTQLFVRVGVLSSDGEGSQGIQSKMLKEEQPSEENTYPAEDYRLTLSKTNSGFTGKLNDGEEEIIFTPEIVNVQDEKMYVGFYTARVATIQISNIDLSVTAAATDAPREYPPEEPVEPQINVLSLAETSDENYSFITEANVDGTITVKQGEEILSEHQPIEKGKENIMETVLAKNQSTNFSVTFIPDDTQFLTDYSKQIQNFTVTMKTYDGEDGDIIVSPEGTANGNGTRKNPLDLDTAITYVQKGQRILVEEGHYIRNGQLEIKKYNDGTKENRKYLIADPNAMERPVIDFDKKSAGMVHSGDYWHVEGLDFARSSGNTKGYTIGGDHNIIRNLAIYENGDTGLQISRTDNAANKEDWPSHNLIENTISFDNRDPSDNNADGFAAKLTSGEGNIFRGTIAHNNIDDGWDLYTKVGTGEIGPVLIEYSIAYNNGFLTDGTVGAGDKNGFKLGGEGVHVPHTIRNSIAYGNGATGFTSNSNPGVISKNNISFNNNRNVDFSTYGTIEDDFSLDGFISFHTADEEAMTLAAASEINEDNYPDSEASAINFMFNGTETLNQTGDRVPDELLTLLRSVEEIDRDQEGNIDWGTIWTEYETFLASYQENVKDPDEEEENGSEGESGEEENSSENQNESDEENDHEDTESESSDDSQGDADDESLLERGENKGHSNSNEQSSSDENVENNNGNSTLPETSTNMYNYILLAILFIATGFATLFITRKKNKSVRHDSQ